MLATVIEGLMDASGPNDSSTFSATAAVGAHSHAMRVAERIAVNRTVGGVHFPADNLCGALLGIAVGEVLVNILRGANATNTYEIGRAADLDHDFSLKAVYEALTHGSTTSVTLSANNPQKRQLVTAMWHAALAERP